tara:strand:+ start:30 stop:914 length:885 start_codon:yes stop_codon:yes gene_type:complete
MIIFLIFTGALFIYILFRLIESFILRKKKKKFHLHLNSNFFIETIQETINDKKYNLLEERRRLKKVDAYGNENLSRWLGNPPLKEVEIKKNFFEENSNFKEGIPYFWKVVLLKKFLDVESFFNKWDCYRTINPFIDDEIQGIKRKLNRDDWYVFIASLIEKSCLSISDRNNMREFNHNYKKGIKFENKCLQILRSKGWKVEETSKTGDQGVDLIASINEFRICIQCKDHLKAIGNRAVQEVSAGKIYWKGTHAILVSKSGFTQSAIKLARANKVILINDEELMNIEEFILPNNI